MDQLTKIPNRRSFDVKLQDEWNHAVRNKTPISILIADIDFFKNYNDKYGHLQGDTALQAISKVFKKTLKRSLDFVARWGGEEFIFLLPNTQQSGALGLAEKIRAGVESLDIPSAGGMTNLTLSIGVNSLIPASNDSVDVFLSGADEALYSAKRNGRNKVCFFGDEQNGQEKL